jgi:Ca2+-binding RTX toxin-like protein
LRDDAAQNAATWDSKGQTVRDQNRIAVDLGMTDSLRASYGASLLSGDVKFSNFAVNFSYTDGNKVDIVRIGDQLGEAANIQDHRARTDNSRDLIFGLAGDDEIYGGGGNDWLYGDAGNDNGFDDGHSLRHVA